MDGRLSRQEAYDAAMTITENKDEELPDHDSAKEFYAKYEPKDILGK